MRLVESESAERRDELLRASPALADRQLAEELKDICLEGWSSDSTRALNAARSLSSLARVNPDREILALNDWANGIAELVVGSMEHAINLLDRSRDQFLQQDNVHSAAATQISKLIALAMLGRYDEAIECGLTAREVFRQTNDTLAIGKVEHNIGNIYFRRDQYREAEEFQRSARQHFLAANDQIQIAKIENSLALTLSQQHQVNAAEHLYQQALSRAERVGLVTTQAEIESSIGTLALYQGFYDRALDYLERSRRKYVELNRPHILALTEQEIADTYLELNLASEATKIYERVVERFAQLGMRAEEARALAYQARAEIATGDFESAQPRLEIARELYVNESNSVGAALVELTAAQLHYERHEYLAARDAALRSAIVLESAGNPRRMVFAQWLAGESARAAGAIDETKKQLLSTLETARLARQSDIVARCLTSLGLIAATDGQDSVAENYFVEAITIIEQLRAPLPAEEFRTAFLTDKLVSYQQLVKLCLDSQRLTDSLSYLERARSRALLDSLTGGIHSIQPRDDFEVRQLRQLEDLRHELSYLYSQVNQGPASRSEASILKLHQAVTNRETQIQEVMRQLQHRAGFSTEETPALDLDGLRRSLGTDKAFVEFTAIDDELIAFVITAERFEVYRGLGSEAELTSLISNFRFQIDSLRFGSRAIRRHVDVLTNRARQHLENIYEKIWRPLEEIVGNKNLVIVPHGSLHYLPFHALYDGAQHLIETRTVSYAPSATVLQLCLQHRARHVDKALLIGVADERTPRIIEEITKASAVFKDPVTLMNSDATIEAVTKASSEAQLIHLACHAQFRKENPQFSSLQLGDGWLTVSDASKLNLNCELVTLSACDTGVNAVAPGEELIGLARGFLSAGAPAVLLSLWTVDDEATAELMTHFYSQWERTSSIAESLRFAQLQIMRTKSHPFFWSPFVLVGRW